MILDEVQNYPELLLYLKVVVDEQQENGKYILTGSQHFVILDNITQSLAGRTAVLSMYALTINELYKDKLPEVEKLILNGFYPKLHKENILPNKYYNFYIQTYIEKDIRKLINITDLSLFRKFLKLCAGKIGQILNIQSLCNDTGISHNTATKWLSLLEVSYIIRLLEPYHTNLGKRLIKSLKLYFTDVGLAANLLNINYKEHIESHPLKGQLFENLVVMELLKQRNNLGLQAGMYFYRGNNKNEVDLILEAGSNIYPIEIKSSETFSRSFLKNIENFQKNYENAKQGYLIFQGHVINSPENITLLNYKEIKEIADLK